MKYKRLLITGGAGFIGSNIAVKLKSEFPSTEIVCLDNLKRRGSELNIRRLNQNGIIFIHGDIRTIDDISQSGDCDLIIECSAEPSVLAGINSSPSYLINTNLFGSINCLEYARLHQSDFIFLSTSRVYSIDEMKKAKIVEKKTRFDYDKNQINTGISYYGISEQLSYKGDRSLYGATKLSSELIIQEYASYFDINVVINRCGVIAGPWQMGKIDQGFVALWVASHFLKKDLTYIGFGGTGKQVRDVLHIDDLYRLIRLQITDINKFNKKVFNVGGGRKNSISLQELTLLCQKITGNETNIKHDKKTRPVDLPIYISDCREIHKYSNWQVSKNLETIVKDIYNWLVNNKNDLSMIFNQP